MDGECKRLPRLSGCPGTRCRTHRLVRSFRQIGVATRQASSHANAAGTGRADMIGPGRPNRNGMSHASRRDGVVLPPTALGLLYCVILGVLLMLLQVELHERAHLAAGKGTLRRVSFRQCRTTPAFQHLSISRQIGTYAAGSAATLLFAAACAVASNALAGSTGFWHRWTAVTLVFVFAGTAGLLVANLLPLSTDGRMLAALVAGAARRNPPDLDLVPGPTPCERLAAFVLAALVFLAIIMWKLLFSHS